MKYRKVETQHPVGPLPKEPSKTQYSRRIQNPIKIQDPGRA